MMLPILVATGWLLLPPAPFTTGGPPVPAPAQAVRQVPRPQSAWEALTLVRAAVDEIETDGGRIELVRQEARHLLGKTPDAERVVVELELDVFAADVVEATALYVELVRHLERRERVLSVEPATTEPLEGAPGIRVGRFSVEVDLAAGGSPRFVTKPADDDGVETHIRRAAVANTVLLGPVTITAKAPRQFGNGVQDRRYRIRQTRRGTRFTLQRIDAYLTLLERWRTDVTVTRIQLAHHARKETVSEETGVKQIEPAGWSFEIEITVREEVD